MASQFLQDLNVSIETVQPDTQLLLKLIDFIVNGDTDVYQLAYNTLKKLATKEEVSELLTSAPVVDALTKGAQGNSISQIRILELVVELGNSSQTLFRKYESEGLLRQALEVYFTDDLLTKLASIQVIEKFGDSEASCQYLIRSAFMAQLGREFENPGTETMTRLTLLVLFSKLHAWTHNYEFSQVYWELLQEALNSSSYTLYNYGFLAFSHTASEPEGVARLFSNNNLIAAWSSHQRATQSESKASFYLSLALVMRNAGEVEAKQAFNSVQLNVLHRDFKTVFNDVKSAVLEAVEASAKYAWAAEKLYSDPSFAEAILTRSPHNSAEICRRLYSTNKAALESGAQFDSVLLGHLRQFVAAGVFAVVETFEVLEEAN
mmetsp:Transcript_18851/g.34141  ORF Transcript_18851/g.34141 Transcript_18851/m.34141 type:complete len:377 (-) Transcript_18851:32-1162(-)